MFTSKANNNKNIQVSVFTENDALILNVIIAKQTVGFGCELVVNNIYNFSRNAALARISH